MADANGSGFSPRSSRKALSVAPTRTHSWLRVPFSSLGMFWNLSEHSGTCQGIVWEQFGIRRNLQVRHAYSPVIPPMYSRIFRRRERNFTFDVPDCSRHTEVMKERSRDEVGAIVKARRLELGRTQADIVAAAKVDPKTYGALESGARWPQEGSRIKIEAALEWETGSIDAVLAGGDATPLEVRTLALRTRGGRGIETELADAIAAARDRARLDPDGEADKQAELLSGVRSAWTLAQLANDLGANPADIKDFVQSSFGILTGSGVLGLIARDQELLAEVIREFAQADEFGGHQARRSRAYHHQSGGDRNDLEAASQPSASPEGNENEEVMYPNRSDLEVDFNPGDYGLAARRVTDEDKPG